jgi:hypothetical protein
MKVKCIWNEYINYDRMYHISIGKIYEAKLNKCKKQYILINDLGQEKRYPKSFFKVVEK